MNKHLDIDNEGLNANHPNILQSLVQQPAPHGDGTLTDEEIPQIKDLDGIKADNIYRILEGAGINILS